MEARWTLSCFSWLSWQQKCSKHRWLCQVPSILPFCAGKCNKEASLRLSRDMNSKKRQYGVKPVCIFPKIYIFSGIKVFCQSGFKADNKNKTYFLSNTYIHTYIHMQTFKVKREKKPTYFPVWNPASQFCWVPVLGWGSCLSTQPELLFSLSSSATCWQSIFLHLLLFINV